MKTSPFQVVSDFEAEIAAWAGAAYAVAVESCSAALFLSCLYRRVHRGPEAVLPAYTYPSAACAVLHAGGWLRFEARPWSGVYEIAPFGIWDGALRFRPLMYERGLHCLSFHAKKHLAIGRGGMILTHDDAAVAWLRRMRFDGRGPYPLDRDALGLAGWNMYLEPEQASRGLRLFEMLQARGILPDLDVPAQGYLDLRTVGRYRTLAARNYRRAHCPSCAPGDEEHEGA